MDELVETCKLYLNNPKYVFKSCGNYTVILEKLDDTITNEHRSNIADPKYAKYRANKLKVLLIVNKFDPLNILEKIENSFYKEKKVIYITNEIIEIDDYDMDLENVCSTGIHYFKTIEQSFFLELINFNPTHAGKWIGWHKNGIKKIEGEYKAGKKEGKWIEWHENGIKMSEEEYKEEKLEGKRNAWYENGQIMTEEKYKEGNKEGKYILWYNGGIKWREGEYKEGIEEGKWILWYRDGTKMREGEYKEGKQEGKWTAWYNNGTKMSEGEYKEGKQEGIWLYWHENGFVNFVDK
jgi:antitoxin component YwqK of YwqJK toxin-antitoxin module